MDIARQAVISTLNLARSLRWFIGRWYDVIRQWLSMPKPPAEACEIPCPPISSVQPPLLMI